MFALKKHGNDSTTTLDDLCDNLLLEILNKLSPRNMVLATVVSKLWHRLISTACIPALTSSPPQALLHPTSPAPQDPQFSEKNVTQDLSWFNNHTTPFRHLCHFLPFEPFPNEVLDCGHGLLLLLNRTTNYFYLCNLSTELYISFPNSPSQDDDDEHVWSHLDCCDGAAAALIFDPLCKVAYICKDTRFKLRIFTVATARWEALRFDYQSSVGNCLRSRSIFFDGFLHVLALDGYLMRFGIKEGAPLRAIKLPEIVDAGKHPIGGIAVSRGRLHYTWNDASNKMMVWTLGQGDDWELKYTISSRDFLDTVLLHSNHLTATEQLTKGSSSDQPCFSVLSFDPASDLLYVADFNHIYRYDPCINKVEKLCSVNRPRIIFGWNYFTHLYSVNLSSLFSICMGCD